MINRVLVFTALLLVAGAATACNVSVTFGDGIKGSGNIVTESFDLDGFDELRVGSAFEVDVEVGPDFDIIVRADDNLMEHVNVDVADDQLRIDLDESLSSGTLEATVRLPALAAIDISGATEVTIVGVDTDVFDADISGASEVTASGSANELRLDVGGASDVRLDGLIIDTARVDINGASDVELSNASTIRGDLNGASDLTVSSEADASLDINGASTLSRS